MITSLYIVCTLVKSLKLSRVSKLQQRIVVPNILYYGEFGPHEGQEFCDRQSLKNIHLCLNLFEINF